MTFGSYIGIATNDCQIAISDPHNHPYLFHYTPTILSSVSGVATALFLIIASPDGAPPFLLVALE